MVEVIKHHTGKKKVDLVAHSMGGLVVRRYIQLFGEESVDKVIMIATPNGGLPPESLKYCPILGESKECEDMANESVFMRRLNDPLSQPVAIEFTSIVASGCTVGTEDGDGVVTVSSANYTLGKSYAIEGECTDFFGSDLHTEILNIDEHPQVYDIIRDELKK
jgi:triacylglycerol esterase/lipase EstA (alpha/beta hydrolase family)